MYEITGQSNDEDQIKLELRYTSEYYEAFSANLQNNKWTDKLVAESLMEHLSPFDVERKIVLLKGQANTPVATALGALLTRKGCSAIAWYVESLKRYIICVSNTPLYVVGEAVTQCIKN